MNVCESASGLYGPASNSGNGAARTVPLPAVPVFDTYFCGPYPRGA